MTAIATGQDVYLPYKLVYILLIGFNEFLNDFITECIIEKICTWKIHSNYNRLPILSSKCGNSIFKTPLLYFQTQSSSTQIIIKNNSTVKKMWSIHVLDSQCNMRQQST